MATFAFYPTTDRMSLFLSPAGANRAGKKAVAASARAVFFTVAFATLSALDGTTDRGFKVTMFNASGHPLGNL